MTIPEFRITIEDLVIGTKEIKEVPAGDYFILTTSPCHISNIQTYSSGTHVLTIKGRRADGREHDGSRQSGSKTNDDPSR